MLRCGLVWLANHTGRLAREVLYVSPRWYSGYYPTLSVEMTGETLEEIGGSADIGSSCVHIFLSLCEGSEV